MDLEVALTRYAEALSRLQVGEPQPTAANLLSILVARNAVQEALQDKTQISLEHGSKLLDLDHFLRKQSDAIATEKQLDTWRKTFNPPPEAWWWYFEPPQALRLHPLERFEWVFNTLTLISLTAVTAYLTLFIKLFSTGGGYGVLETFGIIGQGGLILTTLSTLRSDGQQWLKNGLKSFNISPRYHSLVTCGLSLLLLSTTYRFYLYLPTLAQSSKERAVSLYQKGYLTKAKRQLEQAAAIAPQASNLQAEIQIWLGAIHESLGNLDEAVTAYKQAIEKGADLEWNVDAMSSLGRVYINKDSLPVAETYLRMGLYNQQEATPDALALLNRNLGWVALERQQYPEAEKLLRTADRLEQEIIAREKVEKKKLLFSRGLSSCLLFNALAQQRKDVQEQAVLLKRCKEIAQPETIGEYQWFLKNSSSDIVRLFDTSGIVDSEQLQKEETKPE